MACIPRVSKLVAYLRSQPPVAVFIASLVCLILTAMGMAIHMSSADNHVQNFDVLDWSKLFHYVSKQSFCVLEKSGDISKDKFFNTSWIVKKINLKSQMFTPAFQLQTEFPFLGEGEVSLNHLGLGHSSQNVSVDILVQSRSSLEACLRISGKKEVLKDLQVNATSSGCFTDPSSSSVRPHAFKAHNTFHLPSSWCSEPNTMMSVSPKVEDWDKTFLTEEDRGLMVGHLVSSAVLLALVVLILLLWAAVKGGTDTRTVSTKSSEDGRGDLQLLSKEEQDSDSEEF